MPIDSRAGKCFYKSGLRSKLPPKVQLDNNAVYRRNICSFEAGSTYHGNCHEQGLGNAARFHVAPNHGKLVWLGLEILVRMNAIQNRPGIPHESLSGISRVTGTE